MLVEDRSAGASVSKLVVVTRGFAYNDSLQLGDTDPVKDVLLGDLDRNGFEELYIITQAACSGSYGKVYGVASNKDLSSNYINVPEIKAGSKMFAGYRGHDSIYISGEKLFRQFPLYANQDPNATPNRRIPKDQVQAAPWGSCLPAGPGRD
jgi:hypothetical protein